MSELLRRITRQISPYHNPEGFTFDKGRLFGETRRKSQATPKQMPDVLALALVEKLGDELKQDVEHIERPVVTRRKPRKPKNEADDKGKSRARLTKSKVAALVHEASAVQEIELPVRRNGRVKSENFVRHAKVHKKVFKGHSQSSQDREEDAISISYPATEVVGHGSFGVVFTTQVRETGDRVAIKKVLQDRRFKNRELEIMKQLQHPQVVDLKYYFYETDPQGEVYLNLILEYMPQSLYQRLRHFVSQRSNMPRIEIKLYMYQLAKSLNYLHTNARVCHRDIKPQNLLVDPQTFALKLCDFGSAKQLKPSEPNVSYICSRYYRAPELIFGASNYTVQIDIWSSGCVMAELILGQPMFPGESGIDQLVEIIKILGTPTKQEICSMNPNYMEHKFPQIRPIPLAKVFKREDDETIRFLFDVLRYDPTERYTALQCLCAPYFDELRTTQDAELLAVIKNLKLMEFSDEMEFSTLSPQEASEAKARLLP